MNEKLEKQYGYRDQLVSSLVRDLIGPEEEREVLEDAPITRYISGILYPQQSGGEDAETDIDVADEGEDGGPIDPPVALANVQYPASMGITFAVDTMRSPTIRVELRAAKYVELDKDIAPVRAAVEDDELRRAGNRQPWRRVPLDLAPQLLDVTSPTPGRRMTLSEGLALYERVRPPDEKGAAAVTLVLLNTNTWQPGAGSRDALSFYQPEIVVVGVENEDAFVERPTVGKTTSEADRRSYSLLYRDEREFAAGHGCSVMWEQAPGEISRATRIGTTFAPTGELRLAWSNPAIALNKLGMKYMAEAPRAEVIAGLEELCDGYGAWIAQRWVEAGQLAAQNAEWGSTAQEHLRVCETALLRMRNGVRLLGSDETVWKAFQLMNEAMLEQRSRAEWLRSGKITLAPERTEGLKWRPFQTAFILLCLDGIANPASGDRETADLLWFPTGGGKTEAYLGLIAFTVFLRRLRNRDGGGVTALMRYTLRLLTTQQFERASLLICCMEHLRRRERDLGDEPISIGLWVGQKATPNNLDQARVALNQLRQGHEPQESNPRQLSRCPWCGADLREKNYYIAEQPRRLVIACRRPECEFEQGLPVYVVDEDIYAVRPTLLISTVDKFAALPWDERVGELFNRAMGRRPAQLPPELIIQDELHLISGPLGTLVGLYETAIDHLCTTSAWIRPKVVASTATIRRSGEQAQALFNRKLMQFPPPGLDAGDSYFAVEAPREEKGTRLYLGLMAPGTSHTTLLVRTYAALLQKATEAADDEAVDPFWTLVGYFNSLRVLGGARMQVQDDVHDRIELLARRNSQEPREPGDMIELTSREPSGNIPEHLRRMAISKGAEENPIDVILATNMISVGMDVDRLGLMVVMGQPQSTSEYIQATSRVGRAVPGLVVVLFNAARSRDRSHYEAFKAYHSALYRQVEASSVTPFAPRARDRGLHAVLVGLARLMYPELRDNDDAGEAPKAEDELQRIRELIVQRVEQTAGREEALRTDADLARLIRDWSVMAEGDGDLLYNSGFKKAKGLLTEADARRKKGGPLPTLRSLRDVDKESRLLLIELERD